MNNYAELQATIKSFLWDRSDVGAQIPTFIRLAESEARRLLRTAEANARKPFTVSGEISGIPCGAGAIKAIRLGTEEDGGCDLDYVTPEVFAAQKPNTGRPRFYTVQNELLYFFPTPVQTYSGVIVYVDPFEPLSNTCRENWLLCRYPDIYLAGSLKWAKAWLIDDDQDWATPFYSAIDAANLDNPRVQTNTTLRADEVTVLGSRRQGFNITTGGFR